MGLRGANIFAYCGNDPINNVDSTGELFIAITTVIAIASVVAGAGAAGYTAYDSYKQTGKVDWTATIRNGLGVGLFTYSAGMTMYGGYVDFCNYRGYTPVTTIGTPPSSVTPPTRIVTNALKPSTISKTTASKSAVKFNVNQNSIIQLAKENKKGLSFDNAKTLLDWSKEYDLSNSRIDIGHPMRNGINQGPHAHFGPVNHIPIFPK